MNRLKTAVLGLGRIGWQYHIPQILRHPNFQLTAVVDPIEERRLEADIEFKVNSYENLNKMLASEEVDLVVIASPTTFHCQQTITAMEHGCDVFCDKPVSISLLQTDEMIAVAEKYQRKLMVYQPHRASSETVSLRNILDRGVIGEPYMIKKAVSGFVRRNDWQAFRENGGGMLFNYGAHYIDQMMYLTGFRSLRRLACELGSIATLGDADDVVKTLITLDKNIVLDLDINMACAHALPEWFIMGEFGSIKRNETQKAWDLRYYNPEDLAELSIQEGLAAANRSYSTGEVIPWREETIMFSDFEPIDFYDKCYEYFALDAEPFVPISQTREIMRIIEEAHVDSENS